MKHLLWAVLLFAVPVRADYFCPYYPGHATICSTDPSSTGGAIVVTTPTLPDPMPVSDPVVGTSGAAILSADADGDFEVDTDSDSPRHFDVPTNAPEPSSLPLLLIALTGLALYSRAKRGQHAKA